MAGLQQASMLCLGECAAASPGTNERLGTEKKEGGCVYDKDFQLVAIRERYSISLPQLHLHRAPAIRHFRERFRAMSDSLHTQGYHAAAS